MRSLSVIPALAAAALLASCGGGDAKPKPPPGSPENPLRAQQGPSRSTASSRLNETDAATRPTPSAKPGYQKLLAQQKAKPRSRFTPCNLVSESQARAILGGPIEKPLEAPQGPTCIYRTTAGDRFITMAVQDAGYAALKKQLRKQQPLTIGDRQAVCGTFGNPMLYVQVSTKRVLTISAPCPTARRFAAKAVEQLR
jgi:hypothetical protein